MGARDNGKFRRGGGTLETIQVNGRSRVAIQTVVADIADYADDVQQMQIAIHVSELNLFADWIFVRPITFRECLTDERNVRRIRAADDKQWPITS